MCPLFLFRGRVLRDVAVTRTSSTQVRTRRRQRVAAAATGSRSSTCSSGARRPAWCCGSRSIGPGPAATAEESVSVEDCARVSRDLSAMLDVEDDRADRRTRWRCRRRGSIGRCAHADDYRRFAGRLREDRDARAGRRPERFSGAGSRGVDGGRRAHRRRRRTAHRVPLGVITRANLEVEF